MHLGPSVVVTQVPPLKHSKLLQLVMFETSVGFSVKMSSVEVGGEKLEKNDDVEVGNSEEDFWGRKIC